MGKSYTSSYEGVKSLKHLENLSHQFISIEDLIKINLKKRYFSKHINT